MKLLRQLTENIIQRKTNTQAHEFAKKFTNDYEIPSIWREALIDAITNIIIDRYPESEQHSDDGEFDLGGKSIGLTSLCGVVSNATEKKLTEFSILVLNELKKIHDYSGDQNFFKEYSANKNNPELKSKVFGVFGEFYLYEPNNEDKLKSDLNELSLKIDEDWHKYAILKRVDNGQAVAAIECRSEKIFGKNGERPSSTYTPILKQCINALGLRKNTAKEQFAIAHAEDNPDVHHKIEIGGFSLLIDGNAATLFMGNKTLCMFSVDMMQSPPLLTIDYKSEKIYDEGDVNGDIEKFLNLALAKKLISVGSDLSSHLGIDLKDNGRLVDDFVITKPNGIVLDVKKYARASNKSIVAAAEDLAHTAGLRGFAHQSTTHIDDASLHKGIVHGTWLQDQFDFQESDDGFLLVNNANNKGRTLFVYRGNRVVDGYIATWDSLDDGTKANLEKLAKSIGVNVIDEKLKNY